MAPDEIKTVSSKKEEEVGILQFLDQLEEMAKHYFSRYVKKLFNCHIGMHLKVLKNENLNRSDFHDFYTIKPLWVGDFGFGM